MTERDTEHATDAAAETQEGGAGTQPRRQLWACLLALALPLLYLGVLRHSALSAGENSMDAYYHVALGEQFPAAGFWREFPATTRSVWRDHFYDKEWGFHAYLGLIQRLAAILGDAEPPFTVSSLACLLLLVGAMTAALWRWRVPAPWLYTLGLVLLSVTFTNRILMLRPHVFGMTLLLAASLVYDRVRTRRQAWLALAVGCLSVYSYSNPHFVLLPAVAFGALHLRRDRLLALALPAATIAGIALGLLLHPQSPNTLLLWKIQGVDVVRQIVFGKSPVIIGDEMIRPAAPWLRANAAVFALAGLNLLILAVTRRKRWPLARETWAVGAIGTIATLGMFLSQRSIEYAVPFSLLALGLICRDIGRQPPWRDRAASGRRLTLAASLGVAITLTLVYSPQQRQLEINSQPAYDDLALWLRANLPPGTVVAHVNWSEFPRLYYAAPDYRYLVGLDPMFGYHFDPDGMAALEAFRTGRATLSPAELKAIVGSPYVFVSRYNEALAHDLLKARWTPIYSGRDGWILDLDQSPRP